MTDVAELVKKQRAEQGLPPKVSEESALRALAVLVTRKPGGGS